MEDMCFVQVLQPDKRSALATKEPAKERATKEHKSDDAFDTMEIVPAEENNVESNVKQPTDCISAIVSSFQSIWLSVQVGVCPRLFMRMQLADMVCSFLVIGRKGNEVYGGKPAIDFFKLAQTVLPLKIDHKLRFRPLSIAEGVSIMQLFGVEKKHLLSFLGTYHSFYFLDSFGKSCVVMSVYGQAIPTLVHGPHRIQNVTVSYDQRLDVLVISYEDEVDDKRKTMTAKSIIEYNSGRQKNEQYAFVQKQKRAIEAVSNVPVMPCRRQRYKF